MKFLPKILLALTAVAVTSLSPVQPAQAFTETIEQVGFNVVANGSGAFNLTGLSFFAAVTGSSSMTANIGAVVNGGGANMDAYSGFAGPTSFGSGSVFFASLFSGDAVGIGGGEGLILVPQGYISGAALSDSMTFDGATFASLGLTPGTYIWSWGDGANQNFTLIIGGAGVPDGGTTVSLLGCALVGLAGLRRRLGC
jgi:hypothetical protein